VLRVGFCQGAVEDATEGCLPAFLPVLMLSFFAIAGIGAPLSLRARANRSMSSSMTLGRPPWLPLAAAANGDFDPHWRLHLRKEHQRVHHARYRENCILAA
jgi:hypothetical protein